MTTVQEFAAAHTGRGDGLHVGLIVLHPYADELRARLPVRCQAGVLTNGQLCEFCERSIPVPVYPGRDSHNTSHNF